jgi:hypothetical protein
MHRFSHDIRNIYTPTSTELSHLIRADERLNYHGYGFFGECRLCGLETPEKWQKSREDLLDCTPTFQSQVGACRMWLEGITKIKSENPHHGSYGLKHTVERWLRLNEYEGHLGDLGGERTGDCYIVNSAFILAAKMDGFTLYGFGNPGFNMSEKSIKAKHKSADHSLAV